MSGNRRQFLGAGAVALAAAGIGLAWAKTQSKPALASEGDLPSFDGATTWLSSAPLSSAELRGKVVAIQFWTYTCVNWMRTLPYVRAWADKYRESGLVVVGVHTPEFSFEHKVDNVQQAARALQVEYPIAVHRVCRSRSITSMSERIRHHHFGEGGYDESEQVIQRLLADAGATGIDPELVSVDPRGGEVAADWDNLKSSESYLGAGRGSNFSSPGGVVRSSAHVYTAPAQLGLNHWALDGNWTVESEPVVLNEPNGRIVFQFHARDLNLVMGPTAPGTSVRFQVRLDGLPPGAAHGFDVDEQGHGTLTEQRFYQLIRQALPIADRRFEIEFLDAGAAAYDFTFG